MGIKVAKFGGSSVADAIQLNKTREIIEADPARKFIIVSAPGKRFEEDNKMTDLLYLCKAHRDHNLPYDQVFQVIVDRFLALRANLGADNVDLFAEFDRIKKNLTEGCSSDYIASRGEYLNAMLIADYLGYDFVDTEGLILFDTKGKLLQAETDAALREELAKHERAVLPGFYGSDIETCKVRTFTRGGSDITGSLVARAVNRAADTPGLLFIPHPTVAIRAMPSETSMLSGFSCLSNASRSSSSLPSMLSFETTTETVSIPLGRCSKLMLKSSRIARILLTKPLSELIMFL